MENFKIHKKIKKVPAKNRLKLVEKSGGITLTVVNKKGELRKGGNILTINNDGSISLLHGVNPKFKFLLTRSGQVLVRE